MEAKITAIGTYTPENILTNADFEKIIETSDEWIVKRTGIRERRKISDDQTLLDMCKGAVDNLISTYDQNLEDVDFVIVSTITHDHILPSMSSQLQSHFNIARAGVIDLSAACAGFVYATIVAEGLIKSGNYKKILIVAAETLTRSTDYQDRATCILFGDGAGAFLVEAGEEKSIFGSVTGSEGDKGQALYMSHLVDVVNGEKIIANNKIHQDGKKVFKWAVETVSRESKALLAKCGMTVDDIDYFVPHSANQRIIDSISSDLGFPKEKVLESLVYFGNTSTASIPLALDLGIKAGKLKKGDKILIFGFGGGLTYAGAILTWQA